MSTAVEHVPGELMAAEILQQPDVLAGLVTGAGEIVDAGVRIAAARPRFVLIAARGTSDNAALYANGGWTPIVRVDSPRSPRPTDSHRSSSDDSCV
jgi:hypothetical protein